jgi:hypothetical protein
MKKTFISAATLAIATLPIAVAHADQGYTIIVNGRNISTPDDVGGGNVSCGPDRNQIHISIQAAGNAEDAWVINTDPPQVTRVSLSSRQTGDTWLLQDAAYNPELVNRPNLPGNAQAARSGGGKTYKITGNISYYQDWQHLSGTVPFEFDATCS